MTESFVPTPDNCTINGNKFQGYLAWDQLDWGRSVWAEKSSAMILMCGREDAPPDPHWSVPHKDGETWHRVRLKRRRKAKRQL